MAVRCSVSKPKTTLCKVLEVVEDTGGYIIYVFELLDSACINREQTSYLMCVRYPNWDHRFIEVGEVGYLLYKTVFEGISGWYDPDTGKLIPYNYTDRIFLRFVAKNDKPIEEIVID